MLGWPPATSHNEHYLTFMFHSAIFELEMIESGKCVRSVVRLIKFGGYKKKA